MRRKGEERVFCSRECTLKEGCGRDMDACLTGKGQLCGVGVVREVIGCPRLREEITVGERIEVGYLKVWKSSGVEVFNSFKTIEGPKLLGP